MSAAALLRLSLPAVLTFAVVVGACGSAVLTEFPPVQYETHPDCEGVGEGRLPNEAMVHVSWRDQTHTFLVEVARTRDEQRIGLMCRARVDSGTGMFFPFPPQRAGFWNYNVYIPLQILYVTGDRLDSFRTMLPCPRMNTGQSVIGWMDECRNVAQNYFSTGDMVTGALELADGELKSRGLDLRALSPSEMAEVRIRVVEVVEDGA